MGTAVKRSPLVAAYLTLFFSLPFTSNSAVYFLLYGVFFLLLFPLSVLWCGRTWPLSLWRQLRVHSPWLFWLLLLFAASSLYSWGRIAFGEVSLQHKVVASQRYLACWLLVFYTFMMARFFRAQSLTADTVFIQLFWGTLVLISLLAGSYFLHDAPNAARWSVEPPFGSHVRIMGMMASLAIVAAVVQLYLRTLSRLRRVVFYAGIFLISVFLIWTGSRMSILLTVFLCAVLALCCRLWQGTAWHRLWPVFVLMLAAVPLAEQVSVFEWSGLQRTVNVSVVSEQHDNTLALADQFTSGRVVIWQRALQGIAEAPLFGLGPSGYFFLENRPSVYDHTHNFIIEFLVEWGIVGALLLLSILGSLAVYGLRFLQAAFVAGDAGWVSAASVALLMTLNGLVDGVYFILLPSFIVATAFAAFPFLTPAAKQQLAGDQTRTEP